MIVKILFTILWFSKYISWEIAFIKPKTIRATVKNSIKYLVMCLNSNINSSLTSEGNKRPKIGYPNKYFWIITKITTDGKALVSSIALFIYFNIFE